MTSHDTDARHRHKAAGGHGTRRAGRLAAKVVAASISSVLLLATAWGSFNLSSLDDNAHTVRVAGLDTGTGQSTHGPDGASVTGSAGTTRTHVDGSAQNILIVGIDSRKGLTSQQESYLKVGSDEGSFSTDTIMLVHVPADGSRATLVSIPRDSWVSIPGFDDNKINAAYADGYYLSGAVSTKDRESAGASLLVKVVKQLTGVPVNHYVAVGFEGFEEIVQAIGSIPVDLCHSVDDTHAYNVAHNGNGGSGFKMSAGHHDLDPQQALEFVRQRHNIPGRITDDFGRELRQRYFLHAAFDRILSAGVLFNPFRLRKLIKAIDDSFVFDQNGFDITGFAEQMSNLTAGHIVGRSIPTEGDMLIGDPQVDALKVDPAAVRSAVQQAFYGAPAAVHKSGHRKAKRAGVSSFAPDACIN